MSTESREAITSVISRYHHFKRGGITNEEEEWLIYCCIYTVQQVIEMGVPET